MSWLEGEMKVFNNKRTRIRIIGNKNCKINERGFLEQEYFSVLYNKFSNYNLFFRIQCFFTQRKKCLDIVNQPILTSSCVGESSVKLFLSMLQLSVSLYPVPVIQLNQTLIHPN